MNIESAYRQLIERCTTLARAAAKRKDDEARAVFEIRRDHLAALAAGRLRRRIKAQAAEKIGTSI